MPNHVKNILSVTASDDVIKEIKEFVADREDKHIFSLNKIIPMPEEIIASEGVENKGMPKWYSWRVENWSTKWDVYDVLIVKPKPDVLQYTFLSAWSTPINALIALSNKFKDVVFDLKYADEDIGFNTGEVSLKGGEIISSHQPYGDDAEKFAENIWNNY